MARHRIERVNEQLKREITAVLQFEVKDPRIGFATITAVETAPDLSIARVYFTALGEEGQRESTLEGLRAASPYIRGELGRRLRLRRVPELRFELDESLERGMRIEKLLREVQAGEGGGGGGAGSGVEGEGEGEAEAGDPAPEPDERRGNGR